MILVLTGATGTAKSKIAASLAQKINGVVINADAFQVYRELHIATAMPDEALRLSAPHYLFDFIPLDSSYSVYEYQEDLRALLAELAIQGKNAIIAGGTGLYIRAGLYDYEFPEEAAVDLSPYANLDNQALHDVLFQMDPEAAKAIHPNNRLRVLRTIAMILGTGKTKSEILASQKHLPLYDAKFFVLQSDRAPLYERVNARVDKMFEDGLVEENRRLVEKYGRTPRAFRAIGVKELFPYFDGLKTLEECKEDIKKNTRNYVKRQETFFRHQFSLIPVEGEEDILANIS